MGFPGWTIDGSDPAAIHASVAVAREFGLEGGGPTLIHVETMRVVGTPTTTTTCTLEPRPERRKATSTRRCWTIGKPRTLFDAPCAAA